MSIMRVDGIASKFVKPLLISAAILTATSCARYGEQMPDSDGIVQAIKNNPKYEGADNFTYSEGGGKYETMVFFDLPNGETCNVLTDLNYERPHANPYCATGNNRPVYCVRTLGDFIHGKPRHCSELANP